MKTLESIHLETGSFFEQRIKSQFATTSPPRKREFFVFLPISILTPQWPNYLEHPINPASYTGSNSPFHGSGSSDPQENTNLTLYIFGRCRYEKTLAGLYCGLFSWGESKVWKKGTESLRSPKIIRLSDYLHILGIDETMCKEDANRNSSKFAVINQQRIKCSPQKPILFSSRLDKASETICGIHTWDYVFS